MVAKESGHGNRRVFFALWPEAPVAAAIDTRIAALEPGGRPVGRTRLHLTLAFHGACDNARIAKLQARAARLSVPRFELVLDRAGCFRRAGVVWLGASRPPAALARLARELADDAVDSPAFRPHITIARKARPFRPTSIAPIPWFVDRFSLVESGSHGAPGAYRRLGSWPLAAVSAETAGL